MSIGTGLGISPFQPIGLNRRVETERQSARQVLANRAINQNDYELLAGALGLGDDQGDHI